MDVLGLLMAVVFGAVIIFSLLNKVLQKDEGKDERSEPARRPEPANADVERFLAEVNRRRREAERQETRPPTPSRPRKAERPQVVVARRGPDDSARRFPGAAPPPPEVVLVETLSQALPVAGTSNVSSVEAPRLARRATSRVIAEVLPLLRSPQSLAKAIVLQEILGPPKCRRRR